MASGEVAMATQAATRAMPIIMKTISDPVLRLPTMNCSYFDE
ncbi:MAG: hypothetical protein WCS90_02250 [Bacilli bacterium]